ncbi:MAG TPA: ATP-binding cassette domain-containing protein [Candidatus Dormibacteraeota bacterium]|nr:ATP-binding cassette domain-containing protein [Candidatus Dormibacteraeota bacterium]
MAIAHLDHFSYWYPGASRPALRDVSTWIEPGLTVVAGPSGSGKSTLLRVFNGLVPHFHGGRVSGGAIVADLDVIATPTRVLARSTGFVFQDPELQTVYATVDREVAFGLENAAVPQGVIAARVRDALGEVGIEHLAGRAVRTLSGGERQRVALASALAVRPRLVVLDEPTSQLDPEGAELVLEAARRATADGRAVIVSEHRLERLMPDAGMLLAVDRGRLTEADPAEWRPAASPHAPSRQAPGPEAWRVSGATVGFDGVPVLEDVDLAGCSGEVIALAGPNGGGKTTLLRLIAGLATPMSGTVTRRPGRIAYLPQNPAALLHRPSVRAEVQFTIDRAGEEVSEKPERILGMLGLADLADRYPRDLSSGERQRAAIAAVLAGVPRLVLLDEPTRGMDLEARAALIAVVADLRDRGAAVVIATHDQDLRSALADRVVDVARGRVTERAEQAVQA